MILVLLSESTKNNKETSVVYNCFINGLDIFHLRKKNFSFEEMENFITQIPEKFHNKIVIHSHYKLALKYNLLGVHLSRSRRKSKFKYWLRLKWYKFKKPKLQITTSCSNLNTLINETDAFDYMFLSPIFDTITHNGFGSAYNYKMLQSTIEKSEYKIIALGGINAERIKHVKELGFYGAALSSAIWDSENKTETFIEIAKQIKN